MCLSNATGRMDGKLSCDIPFPDGAEGVLRDDQSQLLAAPVSSSPPNAHLKVGVRVFELMPLSLLNADILIVVLVARCLLGFVCSSFCFLMLVRGGCLRAGLMKLMMQVLLSVAAMLESGWLHCIVSCSYAADIGMVASCFASVLF
ncbi:hypothetical protein Nepgr_015911 [Nepenthes gracilis]|uniref:Uncharacterized protein n=1 Tax=Nepenthes gracilis TaxID=150966 RepID=A0AAD3XS20_NEPGR|nr:hypothetical protein Nepgr_015911 [Nepenthes gracilis]